MFINTIGLVGYLAQSIAADTTLLPLNQDGIDKLSSALSDGDWTYLYIQSALGEPEEVKVTSVEDDYIVVVRGTNASAHDQGSTLHGVLNAAAVQDIVNDLTIPANVTITGAGGTTVSNPSPQNYLVTSKAYQFVGENGIVVTYEDSGNTRTVTISAESLLSGCCGTSGLPDTGGSGGINNVNASGSVSAYISSGTLFISGEQVNVSAGAGISVSGSFPNFTVSLAGGGSAGSVTSVNAGAGILVTGNPAVNPTVAMANTGVVAGNYGGLVVNGRGQIENIPLGFNPISSIVFADGGTANVVNGVATVTMDNADVATRGIVALADETAPFDPNDTATAATPAVVALAMAGAVPLLHAAGSSTGEADGDYTNTLSGTTLNIDLAAGEKALLLGDVVMVDGTNPLTPVAFGVAVFTSAAVKLYGSKKVTQNKQSICSVITGPLQAQVVIATTAVPSGASVQTQNLVIIQF